MARGVEAKQYIINKLKETFGADYLGENGGKYYISAPDDGANIQMAMKFLTICLNTQKQ